MIEKSKDKQELTPPDSPPDFNKLVSALLQVPKENIKKPEPKKKKKRDNQNK